MITSQTNEKIKNLKKLRQNKFMFEQKKFIVEGRHLVNEALKCGILEEAFSTKEEELEINTTLVSENVLKSISILPSTPDIIGVCNFIKDKEKIGDKVLILDKVQDPGNLGTIIRSAKAFNFDTIVLGIGSINKYNDKVIRATQGMMFDFNCISKDLNLFIPYLKNNGYKVYGTNVVNGINIKDITYSNKIAIVLGNEGNGISSDISSLIDENIYINMNESCESLNVAVAASIIMYELNK